MNSPFNIIVVIIQLINVVLVRLGTEKAERFTMKAIEVDNGVNITCAAVGVFPEPKLSLFRISQSNESNESNESNNSIDESEVKDKTHVTVSRHESVKYEVTLTAKIYEDSYDAIDVTDHYECRLAIEKTDYMDSRNIAIQSGMRSILFLESRLETRITIEICKRRQNSVNRQTIGLSVLSMLSIHMNLYENRVTALTARLWLGFDRTVEQHS